MPQYLTFKGRVASTMDVDVKCKISGQIASLAVDIGDRVEKGQVLGDVDPVDEERNVRRAELTVQASDTRLEQAKQQLEIGEQALIVSRHRLSRSRWNLRTVDDH